MRGMPVRNGQVSADDVMTLITSEFAISARELTGKSRTQMVSLPRQVSMYLIREHTENSLEDVGRAMDYGLNIDKSKYGGLLVAATQGENLLGGVLMLKTGMSGYIPPWILLMVYVEPDLRGQGIGGKLIAAVRKHCPGDIKLHVEHDNPAKRLYERIGFKNKYLEMRLSNS